ncbi:MAG: hypothetical protein WCG44_00470 [bacterium]
MSKQLVKSGLIWGFILWLIGYLLGIVLFAVVSPALLGWVIMPFGILITLWVLHKKINFKTKGEAIFLGVVWALIAVIFDYFFLVKVFHPADGYYKLDVYLYYLITLALPVIVGRLKNHK